MSTAHAPAIPRFNHVALSVAPALLTPESQRDLVDFYATVFGWMEMPGMSRPGALLVLRAHSNEQFVYLAAADAPMRCPEADHFGLSVPDREAIRAVHDRAAAYRETSEDVQLTPLEVQDFGMLKLHSFYVRYRLPLSRMARSQARSQSARWFPSGSAIHATRPPGTARIGGSQTAWARSASAVSSRSLTYRMIERIPIAAPGGPAQLGGATSRCHSLIVEVPALKPKRVDWASIRAGGCSGSPSAPP
jgi:hypothetical protein